MADDFAGMIADRTRAAQRARLTRFYIEQGHDPSQAAAMATAELARRNQSPMEYGEGDSPRENIAVRTANDALAQRREMIDRDMGDESRQRIQEMYRRNPALLGLDQPAPQLDEFRETPVTPEESDRYMRERQAREEANRPSTIPWWEHPNADRNSPEAVRDRREALERAERERIATSERITRELGQQGGYTPPAGRAAPSIIDRAVAAISGGSPAAAAPSRPEEVTEPGFSGESGSILQKALDATKAAALSPSSSQAPIRQAPAPAPARQAPMPLPVRRPAPAPQDLTSDARPVPQDSGFLSSLFKDPYAGKSSKELFQMAQDNPDSNAMFFRAAAKQAQERKDAGAGDEGMKRGGTVGDKPHKDAAILKALEIIHHMLRRG